MILRVLAAASLVLGVAILMGFLYALGEGPFASVSARHLRAMKNRAAAPPRCDALPIAAMGALPRGGSYRDYGAFEARGVAVEGYVERMIRAADGDLHLDLRGPAGPGTPYAIAEITPAWRRGSRRWGYDALVVALRADGGVSAWEGGPRRVRLSGWLMYDFPHEGMRPRPGLPPAVAAWEVHPVTKIEIWSDSLGRYLEYPR